MAKEEFIVKLLKKVSLKRPILIEGLPGIGNVGKIAIDFIISNVKAEKIYDIKSYNFPNCVFVNENNTIDLPKIELYYKKVNKQDLIFVAGDVQPIDERASYLLCEKLIELSKKLKVKEIITLGGIGMDHMPFKPSIFCSGTDEKTIKKYCKNGIKAGTESFLGPIVGVSGVLLGLSKEKSIPGVVILAETLSHPTYLGLNGAREIISFLNKKLGLKINIKELDKEVKDIEKEVRDKLEKILMLQDDKKRKPESLSYIG